MQHVSSIEGIEQILWNTNVQCSLLNAVDANDRPIRYCERFWDRHTGRLTTLSKKQTTFAHAFTFYYESSGIFVSKSVLTRSFKTVLVEIEACSKKPEIVDNPFFSLEERSKGFELPSKPLKSLELYCGAGGLSHGLFTSGALNPCWLAFIKPEMFELL